jgi:hypothetical protein
LTLAVVLSSPKHPPLGVRIDRGKTVMPCTFGNDKAAFETYVLNILSSVNNKAVKRSEELRKDLGMDNETVRADGQETLRLAAERHGCTIHYPSDDDYDTCKTVGDLIDMLHTRIS